MIQETYSPTDWIDGIVRPIKETQNRSEYRLMIREIERAVPNLLGLEIEFTNRLFDENDEFDYDEQYKNYLETYRLEALRLQRIIKPKLIYIDPYYFALRYKAISK